MQSHESNIQPLNMLIKCEIETYTVGMGAWYSKA